MKGSDGRPTRRDERIERGRLSEAPGHEAAACVCLKRLRKDVLKAQRRRQSIGPDGGLGGGGGEGRGDNVPPVSQRVRTGGAPGRTAPVRLARR